MIHDFQEQGAHGGQKTCSRAYFLLIYYHFVEKVKYNRTYTYHAGGFRMRTRLTTCHILGLGLGAGLGLGLGLGFRIRVRVRVSTNSEKQKVVASSHKVHIVMELMISKDLKLDIFSSS